ncbi:EcsC family protein [uncultured Xanthomonas sp.]|uniref:EcsC family protein n=1 Tax=uncultured Xanthomonas sp. TaxID=152831 RepID=UPI0025E05AEC|nr:EcsC family protein [uncultured Xanthomonas sp.]
MLSEYEKRALAQIHAWKNPRQTWFDTAMAYVNKPLEIAGHAVDRIPGFSETCSKATSGIVGLVNDLSQWSVRPDAIMEELSAISKREITGLDQIPSLDLQLVDRAIGWLDTKYEGLALLEGAAAGGTAVVNPLVALAAIPVDLTALLAMNLRAIGEYGTYCGFDMSSQEERLFSLNILAFASSSTDSGKQAALSHLVKIAQDVAKKKTWEHLEKSVFVQACLSIAKAMGIKLTKAKLANVIPVAGAALGGGFNAYYTDKVCKAAFYLYRERFLALKSGSQVIEVTVEPAKSDIWTPEETSA